MLQLSFAVLRYQQFELNRGRRWRERIRTTSLPRHQPVKDGMGHCASPPHQLPLVKRKRRGEKNVQSRK